MSQGYVEHRAFINFSCVCPAYSPDLNPVERVWWYMRKSITHNRYLSSIKERMAKFWRLLSQALKLNEILKNICVINF